MNQFIRAKMKPVPHVVINDVARAIQERHPEKSILDCHQTAVSVVKDAMSAVVWVNDLYQVNVDTQINYLSVKLHTKSVVLRRDHLVEIAERFLRAKSTTPVELYPAQSRVVDTANQYHIWAPSISRRHFVDMIKEAIAHPSEIMAWTDSQVVFIPEAERDWRQVQDLKNELFGEDAEAIDLLLPETKGHGPVLLVPPEGSLEGLGWDTGIIDYGAIINGAVQRGKE